MFAVAARYALGWRLRLAEELTVVRDAAIVDRKALAADQALAHAAPQHALEDVAEGVALAEATVAVLGEGRVVWHRRI